jgi:hypothetical protein
MKLRWYILIAIIILIVAWLFYPGTLKQVMDLLKQIIEKFNIKK